MQTPDYSRFLHVAAAVICDQAGRILIARRAEHRHQGGLWEFPGGKIEPGEAVGSALQRELDEELGVTITDARPLIRIPHDYGDRQVLLDVWRVDGFEGVAHGREGQPVAWVCPEALSQYAFPAANRPIVTAAQLPDLGLITPDPGRPAEWGAFLRKLESRLNGGIRLVQLRAKALQPSAFRALSEQVAALCHRFGAHLLLNGPVESAEAIPHAGVHLNGARLRELTERPLGPEGWVSAACHDLEELERALSIGVDFVFVSPVLPTASHPGAPTLGWEGLRVLCKASRVPVYALGGLGPADRQRAWQSGAQGIAAIRALWNPIR
ncbi:Nudix family hydrolase [Thiohalomonas denitrificans]|uniref:8-oxo-dGTP diphosphatase n=1 Tax=Thiohalomonas denitrificans TaxID=415747 RepID=A0A1G5PLI3_9GAMM|nr:Nudix family hydrolase [Thiohalomonas denitrificans]SCZ50377.1 8-oxo-dGTP diphosphatase [Thiohalomonas denitrificans]